MCGMCVWVCVRVHVRVHVCGICVCEGKEGQGEYEQGLVLHKVFCKFSLLFTHNKNTCFHKTGSAMGEHAVWNLSWYTDTESTLLQTITLHTMDAIVALEYYLTIHHFPSTVYPNMVW